MAYSSPLLILTTHLVLNLFFTRSLAAHLPPTSPLIVNCLTPGLCATELGRDTPVLLMPLLKLFQLIFARTAAEGAKTYVWAALAGKSQDQNALRENIHGAFMMDCKIAEPSDYALSKEGRDAEARLWVSVIDRIEESWHDIDVAPRVRPWMSYKKQTLVCGRSFRHS
jgi:retinol dehydrogenase-12